MTDTVMAPNRRDFLFIAAGAFAAVGSAATLWPAVDSMNPDAAEWAKATIEVDLAPIKEGQGIVVLWRGQPTFVRHRTPDEIKQSTALPVESLIDRYAENDGLPESAKATDENRVKPGHEQWLVVVGVCTHLGCVPGGTLATEDRGLWGGWLCKCHGSQYDTAGRVRKGPAPRNLAVPKYYFMDDARILIGAEKPTGPPSTS